jgi:hypothetical protein
VSHIHCCAPSGSNAAVLFPFTGVPNATSGSIPEQTFAITPAQAAQLEAGMMYFNVHDAEFPDGEIRGHTRGHTGTRELGTSGAWGVADGGLRAKARSARGLGFSSPSNCMLRASVLWCACRPLNFGWVGMLSRVPPVYAIPCSTSQRFSSSSPARLLRPLLPR